MQAQLMWNKTRFVLVGASGMGKTSLLTSYVRASQKIKGFSCIALDSNFEYSTKLGLKAVTEIKEVRANTALQTIDADTKTLDSFILMCRRYTNQLLIFEDIDLFLSGHGEAPKNLRNLMINGRHQNLGFAATAKRLIGLPKLILQQADYIALFRTGPFTQKDLDTYRTVIPTIDQAKTLTPYEYILYKVDNEVAEPIGQTYTQKM